MPARHHGLAGSPTYRSWQAMKARCDNPNNGGFPDYGGRGIKYCERWKAFAAFLEDMGEKPGPGYSLDRKDANKDYCPENCKWATQTEQNRNRRGTKRYAFRGEEKTLPEWAESLEIPVAVLWTRLDRGWNIDKAFSHPYKPKPQDNTQTSGRERHIWYVIRQRCMAVGSPNYRRYGGKGITLCARWRANFENFLADLGNRPSPKHSVDRIDNGGGYWCGRPECPECGPLGRAANCRWATVKEQSNNRSSNTKLDYDGESLSVGEWAERLGVTPQAILVRLARGWTAEKVLGTPFRKKIRNLSADATCRSPGCDRKPIARGMCQNHYAQWWRKTK